MMRPPIRVAVSAYLAVTALATATALPTTALAQEPRVPDPDRVRIAEAFHLAESVVEEIWTGWSEVPFAILLVTTDHEFLVRHPRPSEEFLSLGYDSLLQSEVYVRDRQFSPALLATFPAVGGVSTVVIGQPEHTGKSSTLWVITALHEHFHQLQNTQPDYHDAVAQLDLTGGDETGMWMLNYPFPYEDVEVGARFDAWLQAVREALDGGSVKEYLWARERIRDRLSDRDYRYLSFQLWQEGVARYTEHRVAELAALSHEPLPEFRALDDFIPYEDAIKALRNTLDAELNNAKLSAWKRVTFYPLGAAEAILLDATHPTWQERYFGEKFFLERYREPRGASSGAAPVQGEGIDE